MNLLTEPLLRVVTADGLVRLSLPGLLAALGQDTVESLPGLQRHQEDPFHIFLCYLAGAVLARAGRDDPAQPEKFWADGLRQLADRSDDCAWTLVVEDVTKPAFMQPPVPNRDLAPRYNSRNPKALAPDDLDILQTAKNHDVKSQRANHPSPDDWVFALVSLQTTTGHMGQGNYGIARMNSGTGNRMCVELIYAANPGGRWRDDVVRLLDYRADLLSGPWQYKGDGIVLSWTVPWDLESSIDLAVLDPFFVEVARAYRVVRQEGRLMVLSAGTSGNRIAAKELKGVLGDPWTPLVDGGEKAWTVRPPVFCPKNLRNLLFEDEGFVAPPFARPRKGWEERPCLLHGTVLAPNGMGKTNGFHQTSISIPSEAAPRLFRPGPQRNLLAARSKSGLNDAAAMQNRVLRPALLSLLQAGPESLRFDKEELNRWRDDAVERYTAAWSIEFFPWLWRMADQSDEDAARIDWLRLLRENAWATLQDAIARFPERSGRHYRARARAEGMYYGALYKNFPDLKEKTHDRAGTN